MSQLEALVGTQDTTVVRKREREREGGREKDIVVNTLMCSAVCCGGRAGWRPERSVGMAKFRNFSL